MEDKTTFYAPDATKEEREIIKAFFQGKGIDVLAREYAATHLTAERKNMKLSEAYPIIAAALQKIIFREG